MKWIDNALQAYIIAKSEGKHTDKKHVQRLFNKFYEEDVCNTSAKK